MQKRCRSVRTAHASVTFISQQIKHKILEKLFSEVIDILASEICWATAYHLCTYGSLKPTILSCSELSLTNIQMLCVGCRIAGLHTSSVVSKICVSRWETPCKEIENVAWIYQVHGIHPNRGSAGVLVMGMRNFCVGWSSIWNTFVPCENTRKGKQGIWCLKYLAVPIEEKTFETQRWAKVDVNAVSGDRVVVLPLKSSSRARPSKSKRINLRLGRSARTSSAKQVSYNVLKANRLLADLQDCIGRAFMGVRGAVLSQA